MARRLPPAGVVSTYCGVTNWLGLRCQFVLTSLESCGGTVGCDSPAEPSFLRRHQVLRQTTSPITGIRTVAPLTVPSTPMTRMLNSTMPIDGSPPNSHLPGLLRPPAPVPPMPLPTDLAITMHGSASGEPIDEDTPTIANCSSPPVRHVHRVGDQDRRQV